MCVVRYFILCQCHTNRSLPNKYPENKETTMSTCTSFGQGADNHFPLRPNTPIRQMNEKCQNA